MSLDLLSIGADVTKKTEAIEIARKYVKDKKLHIVKEDLDRPWGFFFYIDPLQTDEFRDNFFEGQKLEGINDGLPLQPKILVFAPEQENSWQYHDRRAEIWRILSRLAQSKDSDKDEQPERTVRHFGEVVSFGQGRRHRGGAMKNEWAAIAEIWQHTDPNQLSDEEDIVRLQDDYGRAA